MDFFNLTPFIWSKPAQPQNQKLDEVCHNRLGKSQPVEVVRVSGSVFQILSSIPWLCFCIRPARYWAGCPELKTLPRCLPAVWWHCCGYPSWRQTRRRSWCRCRWSSGRPPCSVASRRWAGLIQENRSWCGSHLWVLNTIPQCSFSRECLASCWHEGREIRRSPLRLTYYSKLSLHRQPSRGWDQSSKSLKMNKLNILFENQIQSSFTIFALRMTKVKVLTSSCWIVPGSGWFLDLF